MTIDFRAVVFGTTVSGVCSDLVAGVIGLTGVSEGVTGDPVPDFLTSVGPATYCLGSTVLGWGVFSFFSTGMGVTVLGCVGGGAEIVVGVSEASATSVLG